ncbi:MAG TPA: hypothetical protein VHC22_10240 [Pirellulales bacterium]|nr:hypothetical protein [Pirellulales bacterium]
MKPITITAEYIAGLFGALVVLLSLLVGLLIGLAEVPRYTRINSK